MPEPAGQLTFNNLPSLYPITFEGVKAHLIALGYRNLPDNVIEEFTEELRVFELEQRTKEPRVDKVEERVDHVDKTLSSSPNRLQKLRETKAELEHMQSLLHNTSLDSDFNLEMATAKPKKDRPTTAMSNAISVKSSMSKSSSRILQRPSSSMSSINRTYYNNVNSTFKKKDPVSLYQAHKAEWSKQPNLKKK
jgi:hypothetical protein